MSEERKENEKGCPICGMPPHRYWRPYCGFDHARYDRVVEKGIDVKTYVDILGRVIRECKEGLK
jgi:hypothetical protein